MVTRWLQRSDRKIRIVYVLLTKSVESEDKTSTNVPKIRDHGKQARGKSDKKHLRKNERTNTGRDWILF